MEITTTGVDVAKMLGLAEKYQRYDHEHPTELADDAKVQAATAHVSGACQIANRHGDLH